MTHWLQSHRALSHLWKQHLLYLWLQKSRTALQNHHKITFRHRIPSEMVTAQVDKQTFSPPDLYLHNLIHLQCNLPLNLVGETVIVLYWILMSARWTQAPLYTVTVSYDRWLKERVISAHFHFIADSKSTIKGTSRGWRYQCSCHCVIN